jgi:ADP-ribose pyrophosphatase YjhB (NUDIX family)
VAGLTDDEAARRWAYLAEGNAKQARKRVSAKVIVRNDAGEVLLVNPNYKEHWDLPGGMAEANESPRTAAERELQEELGAAITAGRVLVLDWVDAHGPWDDQLVFVFDGGTLETEQASALVISDEELTSFAFLPPVDAIQRLRSDVADRLERALQALTTSATDYGEYKKSWPLPSP